MANWEWLAELTVLWERESDAGTREGCGSERAMQMQERGSNAGARIRGRKGALGVHDLLPFRQVVRAGQAVGGGSGRPGHHTLLHSSCTEFL